MEFDLEVVGDGYVATVRGDITAVEVPRLWEEITASRPDDGFTFGILDISGAATPELRGWPADTATLERLHPVARMVNQSLPAGFRMGIVSLDTSIDAVMADLIDLIRFGTPARAGESPKALRFTDLDDALVWCRREVDA